MGQLNSIYRTPLGLLTDLYELTMAYGYWKCGRAEDEAVFHLFFRRAPFQGGYAVAAGLAFVADFLSAFKFERTDLDYLATLTGNNGAALFDSEFLRYLGQLKLTCDVDAVPEGTVVFPNEPLVRVRGPILQAQIIESALLNLVNFSTLIATKTARIREAAGTDPVLEFGLRRAQGIDGALAASRAAFIGGCNATSNVLAGKLFGIPVKGTHAHSWVMCFDTELDAFEAYAEAMPNNCVFLVDTYDTLDGVRHAMTVGKRLRKRGHRMVGIRLDSGDLAALSIEARRLLDEAGFQETVIVASNDLDEYSIRELKSRGATIAVWGVGTRLVTAFDEPALGGVYKLGATQASDGHWIPRLKVSEDDIKTSIPGTLQVRRFEDHDGLMGDVIYDETLGIDDTATVVDLSQPEETIEFNSSSTARDLLVPIARSGQIVLKSESLDVLQDRAKREVNTLHPTVHRLMQPRHYPVGIERSLNDVRKQLIDAAQASGS